MEKIRKHRVGVCRECKVKENDSARKRLYQCSCCEEWFCIKHFEPRLAFIKPPIEVIIKYPELRVTYEQEEWKREDGHPDFAYSWKRFEEIDMEEKLRSKLIEASLNRMSKGYGREKLERKEVDIEPEDKTESKEKLPKHELMEETEIGKEEPSKLRQLNINWGSKKLLFSLKLWFPVFWLVVGLLFLIEGSDPTQFYNSVPDSVKYIFYIFASVISVWVGYRIFEKVDSNTTSDRGLFGLRILSGVFLIIGVLMLVFGVFYGLGFFTESILNPTFSLGRTTVSVFVIVLGLAFMLISAYLLFKFERRSGIIVYRR